VKVDALIFAGVAAAWAIYLIPKALASHDDAKRAQPVDRFSATMRVVARREPTNDRSAALVLGADPARIPPPSEAELKALPGLARSSARRRRRTLGLILLALTVTAAVAGAGVMAWWHVGIPAGVMVAWLIACRLAVRAQRRRHVLLAARAGAARSRIPADHEPTVALDATALAAIAAESRVWDPVPITLPTYVDKATAPRTVRTIDLGADDVWTSGRAPADATLASHIEDRARPAPEEDEDPDQRQAVGS
jgi:hypothetical protein